MVELQIVVLAVAGSSPVGHPVFERHLPTHVLKLRDEFSVLEASCLLRLKHHKANLMIALWLLNMFFNVLWMFSRFVRCWRNASGKRVSMPI